ncbi:MAG: hypothetical protein HKN03_05765 [Acidimicrobiales bacterium]|nr:hypothetical protein [Acidimicrobiales bacterium]
MREQLLVDSVGLRIVDPRLVITLLNGFSVTVGGAAVPVTAWRTQKSRSLMKILALAPGYQLHRDQVIEMLWPELGHSSATNNWRSTLHSVRAALEPGRPAGSSTYLVLANGMLRLEAPGGIWLDVDAFRDASRRCRQLGCIDSYEAALALYSGDLLPEDRYEDWAMATRESLRELWLTLMVELGALYEAAGEWAAGVTVLERATAAAPSHEDAHCGLMRIHALGGRPGQAIRQYERLKEALARELEVDPMPGTRELRAAIASGRFGTCGWKAEPGRNHGVPTLRMTVPTPLVENGGFLPVEGAFESGSSPEWTSMCGGPATVAESRPLTCRERQVAELIASNLTNAAIAGRLGIARRTVDTHVNKVLHKLGVSTRLDVGAALLRVSRSRTYT